MTSPSAHPSAGKVMDAHRSNGVLPISVSATQQWAAPIAIKPSPKPSNSRMKVVIRRLPPSLNLAEFEENLGEEWKVIGGKFDWFSYKPGKVSKE
jgi:regulator of nonsense transcripts 3